LWKLSGPVTGNFAPLNREASRRIREYEPLGQTARHVLRGDGVIGRHSANIEDNGDSIMAVFSLAGEVIE
jgi:hypothetical protein